MEMSFDDISMVAKPDKRLKSYMHMAERIRLADNPARRYLSTLLGGESVLTKDKVALVQAIVSYTAYLPLHEAYDLLRLLRDISRYKAFGTIPRRHNLFDDWSIAESLGKTID